MAGTSSARDASDTGCKSFVSAGAALAALLVALPAASRPLLAQRPAVVRASVTVIGPTAELAWRPDSTTGRPAPGAQRVRIAGVGVLDVQRAPGAAVRVVPPASADPVSGEPAAPAEPRRATRVVVDFVDS